MNNFIGTEYESFSEEEIFMDNQKLIKATIRKKFPNHKSFCQIHMLDYEDLISLGSEGLLTAIKTFDSSSDSKFKSFAINNIYWNIVKKVKRDSLRSINTKTNQVIDTLSLDAPATSDSESDLTLMDTIDLSYKEDLLDDLHLRETILFLREDKEMNDDLYFIMTSRINGIPFKEIANSLNMTVQNIYKLLESNKVQRIKNRLSNFMKEMV